MEPQAGAANAANWRGFVGCIKPSAQGSSLVDMIKLLPDGIGAQAVGPKICRILRQQEPALACLRIRCAFRNAAQCDQDLLGVSEPGLGCIDTVFPLRNEAVCADYDQRDQSAGRAQKPDGTFAP